MTSAPARLLVPPLLVLTLAACAEEATGPAPITSCNGYAELCDRPYDEITQPGTHNAYSTIAESFTIANQSFTMSRQLADGIRVLHLEAQRWKDEPFLCHALCSFGLRPLADGIAEVVRFLADHPGEVVTLLLETGDLEAAEVARAFETAGAMPYLHPHALGADWPTLRQLIEHGERLVVFVDHEDGTASHPWWLPRWRFTFQTPWNNRAPEDYLRCHADRGQEGNPLYTVDVYQEDLIKPMPDHDALVNRNPFLVNRLLHCRAETGRRPNFVLVNFYEVSDVVKTAAAQNGLGEARPDWDAFPPTDASTQTDAGTPRDL